MEKLLEIIKLSPVLVLATLMFLGYDALIAAPLATIYAALVAVIIERKKINEVIDAVINNAKEMQIAFFILMVAYAMAEIFMSTGVSAAIIDFALKIGITGRTVAVAGIIVTSILSIATGSSWGTFAACAPIFLWLNHILGGNIALTAGAIAGGACFGDNIGLISDTTIVSSGIQKVDILKRIRHQGYWSIFILILGIATFYLAGVILKLPTITNDASSVISVIPESVWSVLNEKRPAAVILLNQVKSGVPFYMILPLLLVLLAAFRGISTLVCLFVGIFSAYVLALFAGTVENTKVFLDMVMSGFVGAGSWVIIMMMWVAAFGGIMRLIDAFRPLSNLVVKISHNVRQLMFYNGILSILGNLGLADEMAQIVTIGPIIKEIVDENVEGSPKDIEVLKLRNATFSDALGVFGSQLIPWHVYMIFYLGVVQAVYPLYTFTPSDLIKFNFLAMIAIFTLLIGTLTGLDRFIPNFSLPSEPEVTLKKRFKK